MTTTQGNFPGARFYKADFHIHTPASKCWQGSRDKVELQRIFERLRQKGIDIVAITDHNSVENIDQAKELGVEFQICVFPGVEVTTKEGHVLAIFDPQKPTQDIHDWLVRLGFTTSSLGDPETVAKNTSDEDLSITGVFKSIDREGGIAIAPHPNSKKTGFLEVLKQKGPARKGAYNAAELRGLELPKTSKTIPDIALGKLPGYNKKYGCIISSDAHSVDEIGNAFTYIKLGHFGIGALKQVFYDPGMRIRLPDQCPLSAHPWVKSLSVSQGFFDGVEFDFHPDMNGIVGGKAVGKSLPIEFIRFALGIESPIGAINQESHDKVWAQTCLGEGGIVTVHLVSKDIPRALHGG